MKTTEPPKHPHRWRVRSWTGKDVEFRCLVKDRARGTILKMERVRERRESAFWRACKPGPNATKTER